MKKEILYCSTYMWYPQQSIHRCKEQNWGLREVGGTGQGRGFQFCKTNSTECCYHNQLKPTPPPETHTHRPVFKIITETWTYWGQERKYS